MTMMGRQATPGPDLDIRLARLLTEDVTMDLLIAVLKADVGSRRLPRAVTR